MSLPRLAVLYDFPEEGWPSMDLCAGMLHEALRDEQAERVRVTPVKPPFKRRFEWVPGPERKVLFNADRVLNRFFDYPRWLRKHRAAFDLFHVADHSYAQLVHDLPAERTGVFCHDLDTFRCVLDPAAEPRPRWFRALARRTLRGLQRAAVVFHTTTAVGDELRAHGLVAPERLVQAPLGVAPEFLAPLGEPTLELPSSYLLHVGSSIPRKRVDVLLEVFARLRATRPELRLVKVGAWEREHLAWLEQRGLSQAVTSFTGISRTQLRELYGRAAVVLQPSEAEGFGLPLVEALACGGVVCASDLPAHREVGGEAVVVLPVGAVEVWVEAVGGLLDAPASAPPAAARRAQAERYRWSEHAGTILAAYERLLR